MLTRWRGARPRSRPGLRTGRRQAPSCKPACRAPEARALLSVTADFNGDGFADLAVGVPDENGSGALHLLGGSSDAFLKVPLMQFMTQSVLGDGAQPGDQFGAALVGSPAPGGAGFNGAWAGLRRRPRDPVGGTRPPFRGTLDVTNPGTLTADRSVILLFLSGGTVPDASDTPLRSRSIGPLRAGATRHVRINQLVRGRVAGRFVIAVLDATNRVPEVDENNNVVVSGPIAP